MQNEFLYLVDYDYNRDYNCENNGCSEEGICRCSSIVDAHIKSIDMIRLTEHFYSEIIDTDEKRTKRNKKLNSILYGIDIDEYCINRILTINKLWDKSIYDISICGGYYGQEIENIAIDDSLLRKIEHDIEEVISFDDPSDRIKLLLELEYGYLIENIRNKKFEFIEIDKSEIDFRNSEHSISQVKKKDLKFYKNYPYLHGIVKKKSGMYRIIDGHHRIYSAGNVLRVATFDE